jgi:hypothetical protein
MSRLPVIESSKGHKVSATFTSVTTERNRLISWDSTVQGLNKPGGVNPSSNSSITPRPFGFFGKITKLFFTSLANLPYALFKLGYEIAKLITRVLLSIRGSLFAVKIEAKKHSLRQSRVTGINRG